jgi:ferrochelatase
MSGDVPFDSILVISFGGPEGPDDVLPFLDNVLRGRNVPAARKQEVAQHYDAFGGVSPLNRQNRELIHALRIELDRRGIELPLYWGNRNWHPLIPDTLRQMSMDGRRRALAFFTSAYSSYSGCRQYRENIRDARVEIGEGAPAVEKVRMFFNHPGFIRANAESLRDALAQIPEERRAAARLIFTAHSLPRGMADRCAYTRQLEETCGLVAENVGRTEWQLAYQSRSGPPSQPWLEPDVCAVLRAFRGVRDVVIAPIGFISDHMEIVYDLDTEAMQLCAELGIRMVRARTVGAHPLFVGMVADLLEERLLAKSDRPALGTMGPWHDVCPEDCCLPG